MAMHTERDIGMANPSVCRSHADIVSKRMHISSNSFHHQVGVWLVFRDTAVTKLQAELPQRGVKYTGWKIAILDQNCRLSMKRYDRPMVTVDHQQEVIGSRSIRVRSNDLEW